MYLVQILSTAEERERRIMAEARYIRATRKTVREVAEMFGVSKSTVHRDMAERLPRLDRSLADAVRAVFDKNTEERHVRGGEATRARWQAN